MQYGQTIRISGVTRMLKDRAKVSTTTEGTGVLTLGAADNGFQGFDSISGQTYYAITNKNQWEVGVGTYSSGLFSRDVVYDSSASGDLIDLSGKSTVFVTYPASKAVYLSPSANPASGDFLVRGDVSWDSRSLASGDVFSAIGYIPPSAQKIYSATSGIVLNNDTFFMGGTGTLNQLIYTSDINIGTGNISTNLISFPNILIGFNAGITGQYYLNQSNNIFLGNSAGRSNFDYSTVAGSNGVGIGWRSMLSAKDFDGLIAIGIRTASSSSGISSCVAIGDSALTSSSSSTNSVFVGNACGSYLKNSLNVFSIGGYALFSSSGVDTCNVIGRYAASNSKSISFSSFVGYNAGSYSSGTQNVYIGDYAGLSVSGSNNLEIRSSGTSSLLSGNNSNKLNIQNILTGDSVTKKISLGNVSSSTLSPNATLEILPLSTTDKGLIVKGSASHTANLLEVQNSSGVTLFSVASQGSLSGVNAFYSSGIYLSSGVPSNLSNTIYVDGEDLLWQDKRILQNKVVEVSENNYPMSLSQDTFLINSGSIALPVSILFPQYIGMKYNFKSRSDTARLRIQGVFGQGVDYFDNIDGMSSDYYMKKDESVTLMLGVSGWIKLTDSSRTFNSGIIISSTVPSSVSNSLYSSGSSLFWNGNAVTTGNFPTYSANNGIVLSNNNFQMGGTGTLDSLEFSGSDVKIGTDTVSNVKIGYSAGTNTVFYDSIAIGETSLESSTNAVTTVSIGYWAASNGGSFSDSCIIGSYAGRSAVGYIDSCIFLGTSAGNGASGQYNVYIGKNAGTSTVGSYNLEIVPDKTYGEILNSGSYKLHISKLLLGDWNSKKLAIGNVTSSNINPNSALEILPKLSTDKGIIVKGAASQSANMLEIQNQSSTSLLSISPSGSISTSGTISISTPSGVQSLLINAPSGRNSTSNPIVAIKSNTNGSNGATVFSIYEETAGGDNGYITFDFGPSLSTAGNSRDTKIVIRGENSHSGLTITQGVGGASRTDITTNGSIWYNASQGTYFNGPQTFSTRNNNHTLLFENDTNSFNFSGVQNYVTINSNNAASSNGHLYIAPNFGKRGLVIRATGNNTANLLEVQNSSSVPIFSVSASGTISGALSPAIVQSTGLLLDNSFHGKIIEHTGVVSGVYTIGTITIPSWQCMIVNYGSGLTIASGSNTIRSYSGYVNINDLYGSASMYRRPNGEFFLYGALN